jgi:hypothetical protein
MKKLNPAPAYKGPPSPKRRRASGTKLSQFAVPNVQEHTRLRQGPRSAGRINYSGPPFGQRDFTLFFHFLQFLNSSRG